jgi:hypothetical protein
MTKATRVEALRVNAKYDFDGETFLHVDCADYSVFSSLPQVVECDGTICGLTGWNSDHGEAYYKSGALIARAR